MKLMNGELELWEITLTGELLFYIHARNFRDEELNAQQFKAKLQATERLERAGAEEKQQGEAHLKRWEQILQLVNH